MFPITPPDREGADRERDSIFRIRERRWLDSALREDGTLSRLDRDRTDGILGVGGTGEQKRGAGQGGSQNPLVFGEELQHWPDKVRQHFIIYSASAYVSIAVLGL